MSSVKMLSYIPRKSPVHSLCGGTKLLVFLAWTIVCMLSYDTRVLILTAILSFVVLKISKIHLREIKSILLFIGFFMILNSIAIYLFSPEEGVNIYGTRHELFRLSSRYTFTKEQLFYQFNVAIKYFIIVPIALLFVMTTDPSEFASSLNKIGVSYKIAYAVSIALRYIADIQTDYQNISQSQQARGVELSKKAPFNKRIKGIASIAVPLIFTSLDRIDVISNAMDLRGFGKKDKRTWYVSKPFQKTDWIVMAGTLILSAAAIIITFQNGSRFYNPFI